MKKSNYKEVMEEEREGDVIIIRLVMMRHKRKTMKLTATVKKKMRYTRETARTRKQEKKKVE